MTPKPCTVPSIRLKDGRCVGFDDILAMGQPGIVELASASLLDDASEELVADLISLPQTIGDDTQDVLLGAYNIAQNAHLLESPDPYSYTSAPALVVGSGPSLSPFLDTIKSTYGGYLIVASASAVRPLLDHGIVPHVVAPKERTRYPDWCFDGCPDTPLYAGLHVVPDLPKRFKHRLCVGDATTLSDWAGCHLPIAPGPTSGTHAVSVALMLTTGPVCLIGMDNCGGHYQGYQGIEQAVTDCVTCYDGQQRESKWIYRIARANLARKHEDRVIQLSSTAAVIDGVPLGELPKPGHVTVPTPPRSGRRRHVLFRSKLRQLVHDIDTVWGITQTARTVADTSIYRLNSPNMPLFQAMFAPTMAQLSMERRRGLSDDAVVQWYREATRNILDMANGTLHEMAMIGGLYDEY